MAEPFKVFDRNILKLRRQRAEARLQDFAFLHDFTQREISERLKDIKRDFQTHEELKAGVFDAPFENLSLDDQHYDLISSTLNLHSVNDLPGVLTQIKKALKLDGLFIAGMFGGETLYELRESLTKAEMDTHGGISPRVFPFADKQQMGALLQRAGFALPVIDSEIITVTYENMFKLMHDLRGMGESNVIAERSRVNPGKAFFMKAAEYYQTHFPAEDGRIQASFEIIFLLGWAPHENQQQPLKPGSAKNRLADALKTDEIKTGEAP